MTATVKSIVDAAEREWAHWGGGTWNCITGKKSKGFHIDDDDKFATYVLKTYCAPFYKTGFDYPDVAAVGDDQ